MPSPCHCQKKLQPRSIDVDLVRRQVTHASREVKLSLKEPELLRHLVTHAGQVLTHRRLLRDLGAGKSRRGPVSSGLEPGS
jgi:DNA-binding response OmpR family regulator